MSIDEHRSAPKVLGNSLSSGGQSDAASANVAILERYFTALERGDTATVAALLSDDAHYWILPGTAVSGTHNKASYLQLFDKLLKAQSEPLTFQFDEITAQGDRVAIVVRGHMPLKTGGSYDNVYHWLFTFSDGKIVAVKEFCDAMAVGRAFGPPRRAVSSLIGGERNTNGRPEPKSVDQLIASPN